MKHRRLLCLSVMSTAPLLMAQVPYEYFDIHRIEPAQTEQKKPVMPGMPTSLALDTNTQKAGDLTLTEPFAPAVGTYKRRVVFSQILSHAVEQTISIEQDQTSCEEWRLKPAGAEYSVHRSALVYQNVGAQRFVDIPSDSPEMQILSFRYERSDEGEVSQLTLYRCSGDLYYVRASQEGAGAYRIEYETAALEGSARPKSADFFRDVESGSARLVTDEQHRLIAAMYEGNPELEEILGGDSVLPDLIRYFQGFKSESLDGDMGDGLILETTSAKGRRILSEKKGLCRHRAFLLMLIARDMGYSVRIVANEIHAFVEVKKGERWYPVELGGMANSLTVRPTSPTGSVTYQKSFSFLDSVGMEWGGIGDGAGNRGVSDGVETGAGSGRDEGGGNLARAQLLNVVESGGGSAGDRERAAKSVVVSDRGNEVDSGAEEVSSGETNESVGDTGRERALHYRTEGERESWSRSHWIEIRGELRDERYELMRDRAIVLELTSGGRKKYWSVRTDEEGKVSAKVKLEPDWPLGKTAVIWHEEKDGARRME